MEAERDSAQAEIEREWFKKVDVGEIEEEEDDMIELDGEEDEDAESRSEEEEREGISNQDDLVVNSSDELEAAEDESDEWDTTDEERWVDTLANDIAAMKEGSGKGYLVIIEKVIEKAERKAVL